MNTEQGQKPSKMCMCEVLQTCQSLISGANFENTPAVQLYTVQTTRMYQMIIINSILDGLEAVSYHQALKFSLCTFITVHCMKRIMFILSLHDHFLVK